jgi:hypothetical protein
VYTETFSPTSNAYGLVNIEIGSGNTTDDFSAIDWSAGPYFMETAVDVSGGTNYSVMGTSQLLSVPYALYAKTSGNGAGPVGPAGTNGTDGTNGIDGAVGAVGSTGPQGAAGNDGSVGPTGATGTKGVAGADGIDGATGLTGVQGIQGLPGTNGAGMPAGTVTGQMNYWNGTIWQPIIPAGSGAVLQMVGTTPTWVGSLSIGDPHQGGLYFI